MAIPRGVGCHRVWLDDDDLRMDCLSGSPLSLSGRAPDVPILIEWDEDIPEFSRLEEEALNAARIWEEHHGGTDINPISTKALSGCVEAG